MILTQLTIDLQEDFFRDKGRVITLYYIAL